MKKIECPFCGAEYLPGEIFLPKHFLGQPKEVTRDYRGKILDIFGVDQDTSERYVCDRCTSVFTVDAIIDYRIEREAERKEVYKQKLS